MRLRIPRLPREYRLFVALFLQSFSSKSRASSLTRTVPQFRILGLFTFKEGYVQNASCF